MAPDPVFAGCALQDGSPPGNIRIEIVCAEALADAIAALLWERYYDHYAMSYGCKTSMFCVQRSSL